MENSAFGGKSSLFAYFIHKNLQKSPFCKSKFKIFRYAHFPHFVGIFFGGTWKTFLFVRQNGCKILKNGRFYENSTLFRKIAKIFVFHRNFRTEFALEDIILKTSDLGVKIPENFFCRRGKVEKSEFLRDVFQRLWRDV